MTRGIFLMLVLAATPLHGANFQVDGYPPVNDPVIVKEYLDTTYVFFTDLTMTWIGAHFKCLNHGLRLMDVPTKNHFDWTVKELLPTGFAGVTYNDRNGETRLLAWTALNDLFDEEHFSNIYTAREHKEFFYTENIHDKDGKPLVGNNGTDGHHCAIIEFFQDTSCLNDFYCDQLAPVVCTIKTECELCKDPCQDRTPFRKNPCDYCVQEMIGETESCMKPSR